jgi:hypothetical protein
LRAGEAGQAVILSKNEKIPFTEVFGTAIANRVVDILYLIVLIFLAFVLEYDFILSLNDGDTSGIFKLCLGLIVFVSSFFLFRNKLKSSRSKIFRGFAEGLDTIVSIKRPSLYFFHTTVIWGIYYFIFVISFQLFKPTEALFLKEGVVVMASGFLGLVFPTPGGIGSFHFFVTEAVSYYDVNSVDAFSYANMYFFVIQIFTFSLLGVMAWLAYQVKLQ